MLLDVLWVFDFLIILIAVHIWVYIMIMLFGFLILNWSLHGCSLMNLHWPLMEIKPNKYLFPRYVVLVFSFPYDFLFLYSSTNEPSNVKYLWKFSMLNYYFQWWGRRSVLWRFNEICWLLEVDFGFYTICWSTILRWSLLPEVVDHIAHG